MTSHWEASVPMLSVVTMLSSAPEGEEQEEPVPVLAPVLFNIVGGIAGHERADARDDQREQAGQGRQITCINEDERGEEQRERILGPVGGPDDAGAEDEEGAHIEQERGHMPRAFELHQRMGIDADEPRAEILHEETPKPQNHQHPEQDVQADRRRGLAPAVGDDGHQLPLGTPSSSVS